MSATVRSGIAELARRYSLPEASQRALETLVELLARDPAAATSVRDEDKVVDDHIADSLVALELPQVQTAESIADLGSGAGVPGLPLAVARPAADVFLVESNGRKSAFIEHAAAACGLGNAQVVTARAEEWREGLGRNDLVTARALGPLDVVVEYAAPLLRIGGSLVVWRGARDPEAEAAGAIAASRLGLDPEPPRLVHPYRGARQRHLHIMSKVRGTPVEFPRRPGMARKRPLGGRRRGIGG
jgi:16S rRNA (guanine527-N7)-methyltransferase